MRVFIVLKWFYERDSNLVDSFVGAKLTRKEALNLIASDDIVLNNNDFKYGVENHTLENGVVMGIVQNMKLEKLNCSIKHNGLNMNFKNYDYEHTS